MDPRAVAALFCAAVLLSLSACSDVTTVGAELGDNPLEGGTPETYEIVPDSFDTTTVPSQTGYGIPATVPANQRRQWRFLVGTVTDPLVGTVEADGFIDFIGAVTPPSGLQDAPVDELQAELQLVTTYLHGDTSTVDIKLYDVLEEADMTRAPADTAYDAESVPIETYTVSPTDSLVTLPLPQAWINEHQEALQDTSEFEDRINGIKFSGSNGNTVVGFEYGSATLKVKTSSDSVQYRAAKTFTQIERSNAPSSNDDEAVLLDGAGVSLSMFFEENEVLDSLQTINAPLNRAQITVPIDTTTAQTTGQFRRPLPNGYRLFGTRSDKRPLCNELSLFSRTEEDPTCAFPMNTNWVPYAARSADQATFSVFDYWLSESAVFSSMRVEAADQESRSISERQSVRRGLPSTIPVVVRTSSSNTDDVPRITVTVTPL